MKPSAPDPGRGVPAGTATILSVRDVAYAYEDGEEALAGVSLDIRPGEAWAVLGANGSGKSTLLQVMGGLREPRSGGVFYGGRPVTERTLADPAFSSLFRSRVGFLFQDSDVQLFCPTVLDELLYGPRQWGLPEPECRARAEEVLRLLRIEAIAGRPPDRLSGGEKRRVALGSILTLNPEVLLLDEPLNNLDPRNQAFLVDLMIQLARMGKTLVLATHDLSVVAELGCRAAVLGEDHRLARTGQAEAVLADTPFLLSVNLIHEHRHRHGVLEHLHPHAHPAAIP